MTPTTSNNLRTGVAEPDGRLALEARTRLHALQRTVAGQAHVPSGVHMVGGRRGVGLAAGLHLPSGAAARPLGMMASPHGLPARVLLTANAPQF